MNWDNLSADLGWIPIAVVFAATLISGVTDLWKFRVYNALTLPLILGGLLYHGAVSGWSGLMMSGGGMLFGFTVLIVPHLLGLMGAGDVKLMAGIGAWFGFAATASVFAITALVSGVFAVILIMRRGELRESYSTIKMILMHCVFAPADLSKQDLVSMVSSGPERRLRAIPFAAMVPIGVMVTLLCTSLGAL